MGRNIWSETLKKNGLKIIQPLPCQYYMTLYDNAKHRTHFDELNKICRGRQILPTLRWGHPDFVDLGGSLPVVSGENRKSFFLKGPSFNGNAFFNIIFFYKKICIVLGMPHIMPKTIVSKKRFYHASVVMLFRSKTSILCYFLFLY